MVVVPGRRPPPNGLRVTQLEPSEKASLRRVCSAVGYGSTPRRNPPQALRQPQPPLPGRRRQTTEIFAAAGNGNHAAPPPQTTVWNAATTECGVDVEARRDSAALEADLLRVAVPTDAANALSRTYYPLKTGPLVDLDSDQGEP